MAVPELGTTLRNTAVPCQDRMVIARIAAVPCPASPTASAWMDGRMDRLSFPACSHPSVRLIRCQSCCCKPTGPPVRGSCLWIPLLTPGPSGTRPLPDGAAWVRARCGRAFPHGRCPVNLCLHREAKQTPGTAESAARAAPGAGPGFTSVLAGEGADGQSHPAGAPGSVPAGGAASLHGTMDLGAPGCGAVAVAQTAGALWGGIHPSCLQHIPCEGVTGG